MSITVQAQDVFRIIAALQAMLQAWQPIASAENVIVARGEEVNQNPELAPWVGIYPAKGEYVTRTVGLGNGFRNQREGIAVVVQAQSRDSGARCQDSLGELLTNVINCILSDPSISGTVTVIESFEVSYSQPARIGAQFTFQSATILFTAVRPVGISGG